MVGEEEEAVGCAGFEDGGLGGSASGGVGAGEVREVDGGNVESGGCGGHS